MKNHRYILLSFLLISLSLLISCDSRKSSEETDSIPREEDLTKIKSKLESGQITEQLASERVDTFVSIYGETGMRVLKAASDCDTLCVSDSLYLPRYFIVRADSFHHLLEVAQAGGEELYASMNIKMRKDVPTNPDTAVANLIFHQIRPDSNGTLQDTINDIYLDYGNACPIDCGGTYAEGGFNGGPVTKAEAVARVNCYNCIYGSSSTGRFLSNGTDSVLIAKYYSFSQDDISNLLGAMKEKEHEFFYVSMGAQAAMNSGGEKIPNKYLSDLIFHFVHPKTTGGFSGQEDEYFDITLPCPEACSQ